MSRNTTRMQRHKDKERKNIIIAFLFLMSVFMTLGYAAYQRDLIINAVGKIYSDWDVRFTDSNCTLNNNFNDEYECHAYGMLTSDVDHLEKYSAGIENESDGLGGVVLYLYTEFASPEDNTVFEIEITNYSEMWNAMLTNINYDINARREAGDFILYEIETLVADDGTGTKGTVLYTSNNPTKDNDVTFKINVYWNPDLYSIKPPDTTDKSQETVLDETYKEEKQIILTWEAVAP